MSINGILRFSSILVFFFSSVCSWSGKIVFEDNFEGTSLDLSKWEYQEGCSEVYGPRNLQCFSRNNVEVNNGHLSITAKREKLENKDYTSGRIRERGNGHSHGAYVVRGRFARGDHLWPAIWMEGKDSKCRHEEIDIAEYRGQASLANQVEQAAHWGKDWDALTSNGTVTTVPFDLAADYHEYAVLWLSSKIEWYIDDEKHSEVSITDPKWTNDSSKLPCDDLKPKPFGLPLNFMFDLAVGGQFFDHISNWDPNTWSKPSMEIDWVRIYQE